jgi:small subunit ribosomal protein S8
MSWSDPISDMLTRIRNGQKAAQPSVTMPGSRLKSEIARVLLADGFIAGYTLAPGAQRLLRVDLKYAADGVPAIRGLKRESKPGLRRYCGSGDIPRVLGGMGSVVLSTPGGVMNGREARQRKLGGEWILSVW